ncbi:MAG: RHS repeat-associated core domain-containing protein [Lachnospiraceae bacterium]|nr:RHS repeat-associated core domain-containing protein [Lachnospiraceae bacterium]
MSRMTDRGITENYRYNEVNELLSVGCSRGDGEVNDVREFTYDADGNMTSDGRSIYKYDSMNRMAEAVMEDGRKLICRYDAEGLRHETEENGRLIKFIYSGRDAVCEEDEENVTRYIRGNGRLVASDSEQARTYYHYAYDSLGSVSHVIAGDEFGSEEENADIGRRVLCRYEYDAFGNTVSAEENVANRYGFAGEMRDGITGQYYLRARYYVPEIGRFTQVDMYHGDGLNLYVYARNNPVKYVDPSGHVSKESVEGSESGNENIYELIKKGKKINKFDNPADPFRDVFGRGSESNPKEWNKLIKELKENGVEVKYRVGVMGYGPLRRGEPGQIIIDPNASMSALKHEHSHFVEAKLNGFPSAAEAYQNWEARIADELKAYNIEIEEAKRLGLDNVAEQLRVNFEKEKQDIIEKYGPIE